VSSASRASRPTRSPTRSRAPGWPTGGPFRYKTFASELVEKNQAIASKPVKQAVIAPSMLMLLYPLEGEIEGYSREQFLDDLCDEVEKDIRLDQQGHAAGVQSTSTTA
jgi:hypothetical protein